MSEITEITRITEMLAENIASVADRYEEAVALANAIAEEINTHPQILSTYSPDPSLSYGENRELENSEYRKRRDIVEEIVKSHGVRFSSRMCPGTFAPGEDVFSTMIGQLLSIGCYDNHLVRADVRKVSDPSAFMYRVVDQILKQNGVKL